MLDNAKISVNMPKSGRMDFVLHVPTVIPCLLEHRCTSWDSGRVGEQCPPPPPPTPLKKIINK